MSRNTTSLLSDWARIDTGSRRVTPKMFLSWMGATIVNILQYVSERSKTAFHSHGLEYLFFFCVRHNLPVIHSRHVFYPLIPVFHFILQIVCIPYSVSLCSPFHRIFSACTWFPCLDSLRQCWNGYGFVHLNSFFPCFMLKTIFV